MTIIDLLLSLTIGTVSQPLTDSELVCEAGTASDLTTTEFIFVADSADELPEPTETLAEEESGEIMACLFEYAGCLGACTFVPEICYQVCAGAQELCNLGCGTMQMGC